MTNKEGINEVSIRGQYCSGVLIGNWFEERKQDRYIRERISPLTSKFAHLYQPLSTNIGAFHAEKLPTAHEDKIKLMCEQPFQGLMYPYRLQDSDTSKWISECKDNYRHPKDQKRVVRGKQSTSTKAKSCRV